MSNKFLVIFIIINLLLFLTGAKSQTFIPTKRYLHSATVIDNKLFILGGKSLLSKIPTETVSKQFFFLDFSIKECVWKDLTNINAVPEHHSATSINGNDGLFLIGGMPVHGNEMDLVYVFDTKINSWKTPEIMGNNTHRKINLIANIDNKEKIYLFGGLSIGIGYENDFDILDTINYVWSKGNVTSAPSAREDYGSVILPNQNILYLGGVNHDDGKNFSLEEVK